MKGAMRGIVEVEGGKGMLIGRKERGEKGESEGKGDTVECPVERNTELPAEEKGMGDRVRGEEWLEGKVEEELVEGGEEGDKGMIEIESCASRRTELHDQLRILDTAMLHICR